MTTPLPIDTPAWVRDAVFYQIFPERFARSGRVHPPGPLEAWDAPSSPWLREGAGPGGGRVIVALNNGESAGVLEVPLPGGGSGATEAVLLPLPGDGPPATIALGAGRVVLSVPARSGGVFRLG